MEETLTVVRDFWNTSPCQSHLSQAAERRRYFSEISEKRYNGREWHVPRVANFAAYKNKEVLEIGCSLGTDGLEFAKAGAIYTGLDLTPHSIELAEERFRLFDVRGTFVTANAERLPFPDNSFDHIYSFGVIHHAPHPEKIAAEMHRVLRKGGTFTVMLYNRTSVNYRVEIMFLRKMFRLFLLPKPMPRLIAAITGFDRWKLEGHRDAMVKKGRMTKEEWISMNTDGPFCPLARVYNRNEAAALFNNFPNVRQDVWEFNPAHWSFLGKLVPLALERWVGRHWGWHRMVYGQK
ncbi:MAG TPA: class I SAM-dependent methyltransferase [Verrucomicrobiae bacterium]|jgi:ubiquinone/menaquinone biosynthesis C-methylase UbiE|nr:class I SAM-dependent methyltransferase [Verrucomicrobiae bacterium]